MNESHVWPESVGHQHGAHIPASEVDPPPESTRSSMPHHSAMRHRRPRPGAPSARGSAEGPGAPAELAGCDCARVRLLGFDWAMWTRPGCARFTTPSTRTSQPCRSTTVSARIRLKKSPARRGKSRTPQSGKSASVSDPDRSAPPRRGCCGRCGWRTRQSWLRVALRGYQDFGAQFMLVRKRCILGDEMGLGKTIQALTTMARLRVNGRTRFLVVYLEAL